MLDELQENNAVSDIWQYNFQAELDTQSNTPGGGLGDSQKDPKKKVLRFKHAFKDVHKPF